jgi:hypothetical protein
MGSLEKKVGKRTFKISLAQTGEQKAAVALANQSTLEACVEGNTTCGKCKGGVRAQCIDSMDADGLTADLEIKVALYCRDAACAWQAVQWRPWRVGAPKEL